MNKHANTVIETTPCIKCGAASTRILEGLPYCKQCKPEQEKVASIYESINTK